VSFCYWKEAHREVDQEVDQLGVLGHWEVDRVVVVF
jgi:hypothetical protein